MTAPTGFRRISLKKRDYLPNESPMNILISGAGPAGLTAAYWLKKYGLNPTIVERAPTLVTGGYKIDVRGSALQILRKMNIYDTVVAQSTDMQGAFLVDKEGKTISTMSGDEFGHRTGDDVEIVRGVLCQILQDQIPDVECMFGDVIQEITQSDHKVTVKFRNNQPREFDLVIGADGLHSNVRQLAFGDEKQFLRDLGLYLCVFTLPNYLHLDRVEMQYSELGRIAAIWSAGGEANMKVCFGFTSPSPIDLKDKSKQQEILRKVYADMGWEIPRFLQMMSEAPDFYFDAAAQIYMDHWFNERVVLAGDAGYCASPMSGQGTSLALIGAYVLAGELAAAKGNYQTAFEQYEKHMHPFVKINQALGIKSAEVMVSQENNNLAGKLLQKLMQIAPGPVVKFFINRSTARIKQAANSIELKDY